MSDRYRKSEELLERALAVIPLGSQTFSKSKTQFPHGVSPYFLARGQGSHVWDVDGNEYIDFANALAAVTLGYNDPDVSQAVREQIESGVIFSLPHPLEMEVADLLIETCPCAEMVRFGKNASDATTGAIRLARAYTGRDHLATCGYHGWHDWSIGITARNKGVPVATQALSHGFVYNDLNSLEKIFLDYPGQVAAVIMEPMNITFPEKDFLKRVQELAQQQGSLLVFDETVTGFRLSLGGAQKLFGVTPDLATFGKGLANGYPLAALTGKREIMKLLEEVFFSFTFGGEALSLAAAKAAINKLKRFSVTDVLKERGEQLSRGVRDLIAKHEIGHFTRFSGHPSWTFLIFSDAAPYNSWQIKTLFLQEVFARGILTIGSHNMSFAHSEGDINRLLNVYEGVFGMLKEAVDKRRLEGMLRCKPLEPLFKIR